MTTLNLNYVHSDSLGYGRLGVKLHEWLTKAGVEVFDGMISPDSRDQAAQKEPRSYGKAEHVCWVSTPSHARGWWKGQVPSIFTMFESRTLPEAFREGIHNYETVVVPSRHNVELFSRYHPNVKLVTLGVDPKDWYYIPRDPPGATFNFLCAGSGERKGTDLAYKAFRKVFSDGSWGDGPIPMLIMKNPRNESFYGDRIQVLPGKVSAQEEVDLYASAHCFLAPSRGEGFGLQPLQAIAQGCPTILTGDHGHSSFAHLGYALPTSASKSAYFIFGDAGEWWEPDFESLCEWMEYVYHHYDEATEKAWQSAQIVEDRFLWEHTAENFIQAIGLETSESEITDEWVKPTFQLFPLRVQRPWTADIAGSTYRFRPGQDYHEPADVKRIMFEAGVLDSSCITESPGLLPEQIARLEEYQAEHSFCPTCNQKLNSGIQRSEVELCR
jgi:glycosyltransferase involved in cell wall biosynthesis